jgi:chlorophyll synthase
MMSEDVSEGRGSIFRMIYDVLMVTSAQFWIVAAAPFYIGWFLATREIWPDWRIVLGLMIVGPMIAGSTLAYNAYTDARVDIFNPRKAHLAYVTGWISPELVLALARILAITGMALSFLLDLELGVLMTLCVILSYMYSSPRTKLKSLAGGDVLINMVGLGILVPLGGWAASGRDLSEFPLWYLVPIFFALGSLYVPTLVPDIEADRRAGYKTLAVALGPRAVVWLGFAFLMASIISNAVMGWEDYVLTRDLILRVWPVYVAQPILYLYYGRDLTYRGVLGIIATQCITHGVGVGFMMYALSGWWTLG